MRVSWSSLVPDVSPLRGPGGRDFRAMFTSRTAAYLGSQAAEVALLVQAQRITGSPLVVGTLGLAELVPLVIFGLYGGLACVAAVIAVTAALPAFRAYASPAASRGGARSELEHGAGFP